MESWCHKNTVLLSVPVGRKEHNPPDLNFHSSSHNFFLLSMVFRGLCVYSCYRIVLDDSKDLYCSNPVDFIFCGNGTFCGFFILFSYLENSLIHVPARGTTEGKYEVSHA